MIKTLLTCASAAALIASAAFAEETAQNKTAPKYEAQSATITPAKVATREDAKKLAEAQFLIADANVDGAIDGAEFSALAQSTAKADAASAAGDVVVNAPTPDEAFALISKGDGKITKQELIEARTMSFEAADANRDKALDAAEKRKFAALIMVRSEAAAPVNQ